MTKNIEHPKYLGETTVKQKDTPYSSYTPLDWAMKYIGNYGQIDGGHHKLWVLDQVARILMGTPILLKLAKWDNGQCEYRYDTGKPSKAYLDWVEDMKGDIVDGEDEYGYDKGIAP